MQTTYAQIENGVVTQVIVAHSKAWCVDALGGEWQQTFEDGSQYFNYAGIGYNWDGIGFYAPQCHPEATLNQETYLWDCNNADHQVKEITDVGSN